jgi:hypothetical protein
MSTDLSTKRQEHFQYSNQFLGRIADLIKELRHMTQELERLLHDVAKLSLSLAFNVLIVLTIIHVLGLVLHSLFH